MTPDLKIMLDRVVAEVFNEDFVVVNRSSDDPAFSTSVQVSSRSQEERSAVIRVDPVWVECFIPELKVHTGLVVDDNGEEGDEELEAYREAELRKLCRVMRSYLLGGGRVTTRRRLFGRGRTFVLKIEADGFEWRLGQNYSSGPKPVLPRSYFHGPRGSEVRALRSFRLTIRGEPRRKCESSTRTPKDPRSRQPFEFALVCKRIATSLVNVSA